MEETGIDPGATLMVTDSLLDLTMAIKAAGGAERGCGVMG